MPSRGYGAAFYRERSIYGKNQPGGYAGTDQKDDPEA
ncbi:hypothetical protein IMSAGC019_01610 [Lachnospiraceae bacterium]|nr:hypothetical protein IMSAGC019_01610 [Lachnospiraceae bacterium]